MAGAHHKESWGLHHEGLLPEIPQARLDLNIPQHNQMFLIVLNNLKNICLTDS